MGDHSLHNSDPFNEKYCAYEYPASPSRAYIPSSRDSEKLAKQDTYPSTSCGTSSSDRLSAVRVWENMPDSPHKGEGISKILIHLSLTNPLIALTFSFYAFIVTFIILIFGLVRRIGKDGISFTDQLIKALAPAIRYELRLLNTDINLYSQGALSPARLIGVLIISPLFSIGIMAAAWTAATFWIYTTILGEPNQKQGEEVDGKSAARWVKELWERWLLLAL